MQLSPFPRLACKFYDTSCALSICLSGTARCSTFLLHTDISSLDSVVGNRSIVDHIRVRFLALFVGPLFCRYPRQRRIRTRQAHCSRGHLQIVDRLPAHTVFCNNQYLLPKLHVSEHTLAYDFCQFCSYQHPYRAKT